MNWAARRGLRHQAIDRHLVRGPDHALERRDLALFVVYHLLHLTVGVVGFSPGQFQHLKVYNNVVAGFSVWYVSLFYIAGDGRPVPAPGPWGLEHVPDARLEQCPDLAGTARVCREWWRWWCSPALSRCRLPCWPAGYAEGVSRCSMAEVPSGPIEQKWDRCRFDMKLVSPANRRKHTILVVGSGLAGAAAAATLGEQGYHVHCFSFHDSPRRAHSIAAQGGINAAKNYRNDGDSVYRLFYDTIKGGDFRSREGNCLPAGADQRRHHRPVRRPGRAVRPGIRRTARDALVRRRPGRANVLRPRPDRSAVAARCLPGARAPDRRRQRDHAPELRNARPRGRRRQGPRHRHTQPSNRRGPLVRRRRGRAGHRRLRQRLLPLHQRQGLQLHRHLAGLSPRRVLRQPLFHADSPHVHSGDRRPSVETDADVGVAPQRRPRLGPEEEGRHPAARTTFPKTSAITSWSAATRASATWCRATWPRAPPRRSATKAAGWGRADTASISTSATPSSGKALAKIREKYGNLFEIYERITGEDAYKVPMRIYPAVHYTMGGLWVDYHLMSTIPGLFVAGEANFSDQGANRLGASALMQGLADGYFILPATVPNYLASTGLDKVDTSHPAFKDAEVEVGQRVDSLLKSQGGRTVDSIHRELGKLMWDNCGMARSETSLRHALGKIPELREEFRNNVRVLGTDGDLNQSLEKAGRVADFLELRRIDVYRRPGPEGVVRRPLPLGEPDPGGRGQAR